MPSGEVLVAQRSPAVHMEGLWEFPGGKVEGEERPIDALTRELYEEVGIELVAAEPLLQVTHEYPEKTVLLDTWWVRVFIGNPYGREQQKVRWVQEDELLKLEVPPANKDIVTKVVNLLASSRLNNAAH